MWQLYPTPKKVTPSFPATPSKSWGPVKPLFLKTWLEAQPPPPPPPCRKGGGGAHYESVPTKEKKNEIIQY